MFATRIVIFVVKSIYTCCVLPVNATCTAKFYHVIQFHCSGLNATVHPKAQKMESF